MAGMRGIVSVQKQPLPCGPASTRGVAANASATAPAPLPRGLEPSSSPELVNPEAEGGRTEDREAPLAGGGESRGRVEFPPPGLGVSFSTRAVQRS